jgi:pyruvate, water dikinase
MEVALSVGVQKMVRSDKAGAGVMFTIDTETGFPDVVVINAAWGLGENVVQGTVNPGRVPGLQALLDDRRALSRSSRRSWAKGEEDGLRHRGGQTTRKTSTPRRSGGVRAPDDEEILTAGALGRRDRGALRRPWTSSGPRTARSGELFIVQARPETVQSQQGSRHAQDLPLKEKGEVLLDGSGIGEAIAAGKAQVIKSADEIDRSRRAPSWSRR